MSAEVRGDKSLSSEQNIPANLASNLETQLSSGQKTRKDTTFGRIRRLGARISLGATLLTGAGMAAQTNEETNQQAFNEFKNRTPIEQVVDSVKDLSSIDKVKADGPGEFADISSSPYKNAIVELATAINPKTGDNIVGGYDDGTFRPNNPLWRAQFAKMIVNALELPVSESKTAKFSDMGTDDPNKLYPHDFVAVATEQKLIQGYTDGSFKPYTDIKRAHEMTMVVRAVEQFAPGVLKTPPSGWHSPMGDFDPTHTPNADKFYYNNLNNGISTWNTDPWRAATRGETAQILVNLRNKVKETPPVSGGELKETVLSLSELQAAGFPEFKTATNTPSTEASQAYTSYGTVLYEGSENQGGQLNAALVSKRWNTGAQLVRMDGFGHWDSDIGKPLYGNGRVTEISTVNGIVYLKLDNEQTKEHWYIPLTEDARVTVFDLSQKAEPGELFVPIKDKAKGDIKEFAKMVFDSGDYVSFRYSYNETANDLQYDSNGKAKVNYFGPLRLNGYSQLVSKIKTY